MEGEGEDFKKENADRRIKSITEKKREGGEILKSYCSDTKNQILINS